MPVTIGEIERKNQLYTKSIYFFKSLSEDLFSRNIKTRIEKRISTPTLPDQTPDFIILNQTGNNVTTVIEHKSSVPQEPRYVKEDISETYRKYSKVLHNNEIQTPRVVYAYPITCTDVVSKIKNEIGFDICLWEFDLNLEKQRLNFTQKLNSVSDDQLNYIVDEYDITHL